MKSFYLIAKPSVMRLSRIAKVLVLASTLSLAGCESTALLDDILSAVPSTNGELSNNTIASGLKEALTIGSQRAVGTLSQDGGFTNSLFHIPLPQKLQDAKQIASRFGLAGPFDTLENKMNEAAEAAVPQAQELFVNAIKGMSFDDVMGIYRGPQDAATTFLRGKTQANLQSRMRPIINDKLQQVGAVQTFTNLVKQYNALPLVKPIDADMGGHVNGLATDALFNQLASEEAAIRSDPLKRSTELLQRVFGR